SALCWNPLTAGSKELRRASANPRVASDPKSVVTRMACGFLLERKRRTSAVTTGRNVRVVIMRSRFAPLSSGGPENQGQEAHDPCHEDDGIRRDSPGL